MKLVVVGCGRPHGTDADPDGIDAMDGVSRCMRPSSPALAPPSSASDAGELAGLGPKRRRHWGPTSRSRPSSKQKASWISRRRRAPTRRFAALAAQARIVHVIGTTGLLGSDDEAKIRGSRRATRVSSSRAR